MQLTDTTASARTAPRRREPVRPVPADGHERRATGQGVRSSARRQPRAGTDGARRLCLFSARRARVGAVILLETTVDAYGAALIGAGAAIVGGLLVAASNLLTTALQRRH